MATKKSVSSLKEADLKGKRVFVRVDLNVPLDDTFKITDDTRIRAAVPTIKYLMSNGARVILSSHLGRPKGVTPKFSLKPLVPRISELLGVEVKMADECIGPDVEKLVAEIPEGGVLLLENVRFYKEEEKNDPEFAKKLASLADLYVNDAFGTAHRAHASTEGVAKHLKPFVAGLLMQKELDYLVGAVSNPKKPFAAIVGGSKVSSKIGVIESLLNKVDILILGGGMMFTFYKAQGLAVGSSLVEEDKLDLATSLLEKAKAKGVSLLLPCDVVVADKFAPDANSKIVPASSIPDGWMGLDIGPDSIKSFNESLDTTKTVIWNGPMGVFEFDKFAAGTEVCSRLVATNGQHLILAGKRDVTTIEIDTKLPIVGDQKWVIWICSFKVPMAPGKTRSIVCSARNFFQFTMPGPAWWQVVPRWHEHWTSNLVYDGDMIVLQGQEKVFLSESMDGETDVNKQYTKLTFTPTQADRFVLAFRNWLRKHGNSQPEWFGHANTKSLPSTYLSKREMLDRYEQHTLKCSSCKKAHKTFETLQKFFIGATVVLCAAAGVPPEIQIRLIFAGLAVVSAGLAYYSHELQKNFVFVDYVHAEIE